MNAEQWRNIHTQLCAVFPNNEIKHVQGRGGSYAYIDARAVMDRLDEAVGPENWHDSFQVRDEQAKAVECTITIYGISKSDVGYPNSRVGATTKDGKQIEDEPLKAAYSDALKRAAVHWGIGRFLYQDEAPAAGAGITKSATESPEPQLAARTSGPENTGPHKTLDALFFELSKLDGKPVQELRREAYAALSIDPKPINKLNEEETSNISERVQQWIADSKAKKSSPKGGMSPREAIPTGAVTV